MLRIATTFIALLVCSYVHEYRFPALKLTLAENRASSSGATHTLSAFFYPSKVSLLLISLVVHMRHNVLSSRMKFETS